MRKGIFIIIGLFLLTACGKQTQKETEMDFRDNDKEALADSGRIDLSSLQRTREPKVKITECAWKAHDDQQPDEEK